MEFRVSQLYLDSWIYEYYNCDVQIDHGIVTFIHSASKQTLVTSRFRVVLNIPVTSRQYFMNDADWIKTFNNEIPFWTEPHIFSFVNNGFPCVSTPGNKALVYKPPFFIAYHNRQHLQSNFLAFNNELKSNIEDSVICMLTYNDEQNILIPIYQPEFSLTFQKNEHLSSHLNTHLEFIIYDSNKKSVLVSDNSVLYFVVTLLT